MFEQGIHFYVLYCLCFVNDILMDIMEDQSREEGYLDLDLEVFFGVIVKIIGRVLLWITTRKKEGTFPQVGFLHER